MCGFVLTINCTQNLHDQCAKEYLRTKEVVKSYQLNEGSVSLTKFARQGEKDKNILVAHNNYFFVIGTIFYKGLAGESAIATIAEEFDKFPAQQITKDLDGHFLLIIYSKEIKNITIIGDHAGTITSYKYANQQSDQILLSSSALVLSRLLPVSPSQIGIAHFLRTATSLGSQTIYKEISTLDPASIIRIDCSSSTPTSSLETYWNSPTSAHEELAFPEACDLLNARLTKAMAFFKQTGVVCDLTAGFDSRVLLSCLLNSGDGLPTHKPPTFVFGPAQSREVHLVKHYANVLKLKNHHTMLPDDWPIKFSEYVWRSIDATDGEENCFVYAPILYAQEEKKKHYTTSLNGLGGELYRDFWWVQELGIQKRPANIIRLINTRVLQYEYDYSIFEKEWQENLRNLPQAICSEYKKSIQDFPLSSTYNTMQIDAIYLRQKIRRWASRTITSSNHVIRTVSPLLFKQNLDVALRVHPKFKRYGRLQRAIVTQNNPTLARLKMLTGSPCENISFKNFYLFSPLVWDLIKRATRKISQKIFQRTILMTRNLNYEYTSWTKKIVIELYAKGILPYENLITKDLFQKEKFERFITESQKPGFPYYHQLGNMITLELRMRQDKLTRYPAMAGIKPDININTGVDQF